jgi:hypothetical protein
MFPTSLKFIQLTKELVRLLLLHVILVTEIHFVSHLFNRALVLVETKIRENISQEITYRAEDWCTSYSL